MGNRPFSPMETDDSAPPAADTTESKPAAEQAPKVEDLVSGLCCTTCNKGSFCYNLSMMTCLHDHFSFIYQVIYNTDPNEKCKK